MNIKKNIYLKSHHTFALEVFAECFVHVQTEQDLVELFENEKIVDPVFILGAGSNVLFNGDFKGTVLKIDIKGIEKVYESGKTVLVSAAAGEDWAKSIQCKISKYDSKSLALFLINIVSLNFQ